MATLRNRLKAFFLDLFYHKIWTKIALILFVILTLPVAFLAFMFFNASEKSLKESILNSRTEIVKRAAEEIQLFIRNPQDILIQTASVFTAIQPNPWQQETILVELVLNQPIFMRTFSLDLQGKVIASSELGSRADKVYPDALIQEVRAGNAYISEVKVLNNYIPCLTLGVPIKELGKVSGMLVADINLRGVWEIVDNIKLEKTGRVFLVSKSGILIAYPDKKRVLLNKNLKEQNDIQPFLTDKAKAIELKDNEGKEWVSAYAVIPGLGWRIVLRQEAQEAYLVSGTMRAQYWVIVILSELLVVLASIFLARRVSGPIKLMAARFKSVASGNFSGKKMETKRHDEIGEMVRYFNYMAERLKRAKDRERLTAISEASAWITHEFKNSLASIKSFVQLFPSKHMNGKFVDKFSNLVPEEINRCETLLKELSDFSSFLELRPVRMNLKDLISNVLLMMENQFIENKTEVRFTAFENDFHITADPEKLKQTFTNLIINSMEAMPQGGILSVCLELAKTNNLVHQPMVQARIKDSGIGIPQEKMNKIFEPFYTTKKGGMGLGLSTSRRITEQHGGTIHVESEPGIGTTFIISLPIKMILNQKKNPPNFNRL